jgi:hypothetical protein
MRLPLRFRILVEVSRHQRFALLPVDSLGVTSMSNAGWRSAGPV